MKAAKRAPLTSEQISKLEAGKPILLEGGVNIKFNQATGKYEGIPDIWFDKYNLPVEIDESKLANTKHLGI